MFFTIEQAKEQVALKEALDRLMENADFKAVVLDDYFDKYLKGLTQLVVLSTDQRKQECCDKWKAIGYFQQYLKDLNTAGFQAKEALKNPETYETMEGAE